MKEFSLVIVTPDGEKYRGQAESLLVRTASGDVEIFAGHTAFFAPVGIGRTRIRAGGADRFASSAGGFLSVSGEEVKLVATTFEFADEIDLDRAAAARDRAKEAIALAKSKREEHVAEAKLARALNRLHVGNDR